MINYSELCFFDSDEGLGSCFDAIQSPAFSLLDLAATWSLDAGYIIDVFCYKILLAGAVIESILSGKSLAERYEVDINNGELSAWFESVDRDEALALKSQVAEVMGILLTEDSELLEVIKMDDEDSVTDWEAGVRSMIQTLKGG